MSIEKNKNQYKNQFKNQVFFEKSVKSILFMWGAHERVNGACDIER